MARPLRIEFPGACYHVINRGNFRFPVFREDRDRELILEKLVDLAERFQVRIRAYCVQINHFHCYLQTRDANLGRFMQSFSTSFTVSHNRRHGTCGHVFQGRYKAFLVEDASEHSARVSRYIHLNPACIPSLRDAAMSVRQRAVRDCKWSSCGALIGLRRCPRWLDRRAVLAGFPGRVRERQQGYARYVEQGLTQDLWDPYEAAAAQTIIGSDSFVDRMRRGLTDLRENVNLRRESSEHRALASWVSFEDMVGLVMQCYDCGRDELLRRHNRGFAARQVLLYLTATYCRGRYSLSDLAERLGGMTVGGLCASRYKMSRRLQAPGETDLRAAVNGLVRSLAETDKLKK